MKYDNMAMKARVIYVFTHLICIICIFLDLFLNEFSNKSFEFLLMIVFVIFFCNCWFFGFKNFLFKTIVLEERVEQFFLNNKKEILFSEIKCIYFIESLLILSKRYYQIPQKGKYNFLDRRKILKLLKSEIIIWIDLSNKFLPQIICQKCSCAQVLKLGKISKYIEKEFDI